jgi:hypothetical protein
MIDPNAGFLESGLDSLAAVELGDLLGEECGIQLSTMILFDYPTPAELAGHIQESLQPEISDNRMPLDGELDRIKSEIPKLAPALQAGLARRLREFLAMLTEPREATIEDRDAVAQIESATDSEIFRIIDNELGSNPDGE